MTIPRELPLRTIGAQLFVAVICIAASGLFSTITHAENPSPLAKIEALGLESEEVGRVTAYFASKDRKHAEGLASLSESAAAYFERELGASFPLHLAVLAPEHWFVPYAGGDGEPYGMPWAWVDDLLMTAPASLEEGVLIRSSDENANLRRVQFVLLHEFGHLANKQFLHPDSPHPYSSVRWFEELLATYFAYAFVQAQDPEWAETSRAQWREFVDGYTPAEISLDWGFMRDLPPKEFVRTYAWYQNLLNLRAAELYEEHGLSFLKSLRSELPWEESGQWTTETLLPRLEQVAPGFQTWADALPGQYTSLRAESVGVNGNSIYYRIGGNGPPLLLLHGFTGTGAWWDPQLERLMENYTAIVPDLPGHGRSEGGPDPYRFDRVASDIYAFMDRLGIDRFRAVGYSAGGIILNHMASLEPDRIEAMAVVAAPHVASSSTILGFPSFDQQPPQVQQYWRQIHPGGEAQVRQLIASFHSLSEYVEEISLSMEELANIEARTLIVLGDRDPVVPATLALEMYQAIPNAALWIIPMGEHFVLWPDWGGSAEAASIFPATVAGFLGSDPPEDPTEQ